MSGSPGEPGRAWAAHGSCTLGAAGSTRRKGTSPPTPPECLLQTDHDQTPGGREPGRGGPQGSGSRKSSGGREDADQLAHRTCSSFHGQCPNLQPRVQATPSLPGSSLGLGTHMGEGTPRADGGRLWGAWEGRWCFKREISGGLDVCEQGGRKIRAVM